MLANAPIDIPEEMYQEICRLYSIPKRFYHTFAHIEEVLLHYHNLKEEWEHPIEVFLAFLYHDAIYEYGAKDNEEKSARIAHREIQKYFPQRNIDIELVMQLIRHTANHGQLKRDALNREEQLFLDCDMSILGSAPTRFREYEQQIEQEYTQVYPKLLYRMGRKKFRRTLLKAERIFFSEEFHNRYDAQARINLRS